LIEIIAVQRNRAFRTIKQDPNAALVDPTVADDSPLLAGKPRAALGAKVVNPYPGPDVDFTSSRPSAHYADLIRSFLNRGRYSERDQLKI
jgi:hypothetical protein